MEGKAEEEKGRGNAWLFLGGLFYNGFGICWESWDVMFLLCELIVLYVSMKILLSYEVMICKYDVVH